MIIYFILRHDRDADLVRFEGKPYHGYFINTDRQNLSANSYTIMATGDDIESEDGEVDGGLGRVFYFSSPQLQNGLVVGDNNNDNARKITISRDHIY